MTRKFDIHLSRKQVKGLQRKDLEDRFMEVQKEIFKQAEEISKKDQKLTKKDQEIKKLKDKFAEEIT